MRIVQHANCSICKLFNMRTVQHANCSTCELFNMRTFQHANFSICKMFSMRTVQHANCSICELFNMRTVQYLNCSFHDITCSHIHSHIPSKLHHEFHLQAYIDEVRVTYISWGCRDGRGWGRREQVRGGGSQNQSGTGIHRILQDDGPVLGNCVYSFCNSDIWWW